MPAGINYHLHVRTSYSKDGYIVLWKIDPQAGTTTKEKMCPNGCGKMKVYIMGPKMVGKKGGFQLWKKKKAS